SSSEVNKSRTEKSNQEVISVSSRANLYQAQGRKEKFAAAFERGQKLATKGDCKLPQQWWIGLFVAGIIMNMCSG
ncbi:unnamed protein product, partial [Polarella glacialis]